MHLTHQFWHINWVSEAYGIKQLQLYEIETDFNIWMLENSFSAHYKCSELPCHTLLSERKARNLTTITFETHAACKWYFMFMRSISRMYWINIDNGSGSEHDCWFAIHRNKCGYVFPRQRRFSGQFLLRECLYHKNNHLKSYRKNQITIHITICSSIVIL